MDKTKKILCWVGAFAALGLVGQVVDLREHDARPAGRAAHARRAWVPRVDDAVTVRRTCCVFRTEDLLADYEVLGAPQAQTYFEACRMQGKAARLLVGEGVSVQEVAGRMVCVNSGGAEWWGMVANFCAQADFEPGATVLARDGAVVFANDSARRKAAVGKRQGRSAYAETIKALEDRGECKSFRQGARVLLESVDGLEVDVWVGGAVMRGARMDFEPVSR